MQEMWEIYPFLHALDLNCVVYDVLAGIHVELDAPEISPFHPLFMGVRAIDVMDVKKASCGHLIVFCALQTATSRRESTVSCME